MISYRIPVLLALALPPVFAACGGEGLTLPPEGEAANIEVMSGDRQEGRVGETLANPLVVRVTDSRDRPVADAEVRFSFTDGDAAGRATPATATTDADGQAEAMLELGTRQGQVTGKVEVPVEAGIRPVEAPFTATILAANANGIALVSGNDQTGTVNSTLPEPLVVRVTDAFGNPIPGVRIEWTVTGGGSVSETSTTTGSDGQTSVTRTLGATAGQQTTLATATGLAGSPVTFTHVATAGGATGVVIISGNNQSGSPGAELTNPLVVQVLDGGGNPIPNRAVSWVIGAGGGSVSPTTTTTDAQGNASAQWTLGPEVGTNTLNAVVSGLAPATFTATATAGAPSADNSEVSASPTTITVGGGTSTITVVVRDAANNPVAGAAVSVTSTGSGNTITPASASSGGNGVATFTFSSTVGGETKTITATAGGVTITDQATITVQRVPSDTEIEDDSPDPSVENEDVRVEFTVTGSGGTPTGTVTVTAQGGTETCSATVADGFCIIRFTTAGTNRRLTASYEGDSRFGPSSDNENHRVNPAPVANTPPTAAFTPPSCTVGQPCQFNDGSSDGDGSIANRDWTFQDGVPATSNATDPQVTFASSGSKTVTLTVTDDDGATNSVTQQVSVAEAPPANVAPTASFVPPTDCVVGQLCEFNDLSTDTDGTVVQRLWDFTTDGDPTASDEVRVLVVFSSEGTKSVSLTATDDDGATNTVTQTVTVAPAPSSGG